MQPMTVQISRPGQVGLRANSGDIAPELEAPGLPTRNIYGGMQESIYATCYMLHVTCIVYIYNTYWILYEQLHLFTMMKTRCGVKRGLWKCWFRLQNEIKTRWGDSKNEVGLKHFKTILKRGHSWWKRDHSWWKSAETWKTRLKRGGGTPWIFFTAATS